MSETSYGLLSPKYDFVFKHLFGDEKHIAPLAAFLQAALGLPEEEFAGLMIVDPNLNPEHEGEKRCILDVRIKTRSGKNVDVEIQVRQTPELYDRIQVYTARMVAGQVKAGETYLDMPQSISIVIADFRMWENAHYHHRFRLHDPEKHVAYPNSMEIHTLELPKLPEHSDGSALWDWLKFLSSKTRDEFDSLARKDAVMAEAYARLMELSADEKEQLRREARDKYNWDQAALRRQYIREGLTEGRAKGLAEGLAEGEARGRAEGEAWKQAAIIRRMLGENMAVGEIARLVDCPVAEIERLSAEMK